jgi:hypothetical protein
MSLPKIPRELLIETAAALWAHGMNTAEIAVWLSREALRKHWRGVDEHEVAARMDEIRAKARQKRAA